MAEQSIILCQLHSEEVVAIDETQQDLNIRKLCLKCLAQGYKRKVTLIKESINQVREMKAIIKQDRQIQLQNNIESFKSLISNIEQLKTYYIQQIETIVSIVQKWMQQFENMEEEYLNKVESKEENDIQSFLNFIQQQQDIQVKQEPQFQQQIQNSLINLKETKALQKCNDILANIHPISNVFEKDITFEDEKNENIQLNLFCENHKQKRISLIDMGQEKISQRRLACKKCLDNYPSSNYKTVSYAYSQWIQILQKRQENIHMKKQSLQNKYMLQMQNGINQQFEKSLQKLTTNYIQYESKVNQIKCKINLSWYKLSKEEILNIVEELSNINNPSIFDDPLYKEYIIKDNLANQTLKDILLFLQECQVTYLDQLNPFIKSLIFVETNQGLKSTLSDFDQNQKLTSESSTQTDLNQKLTSESSIQADQNQKLTSVSSTQTDLNQKLTSVSSTQTDQNQKLISVSSTQTITQQDIFQHQEQTLQNQGLVKKNKNLKLHLQLYSQILQQNTQQHEEKSINKQFNYQLIQNSSIREDKWCRAMAFNKDGTILVVGSDKYIKVYEFKEGIIKLIQILSEHQNRIFTLNFMKQSNQFISGSGTDGWIIIWSMNQNNQWICQQKFNEISSGIQSLVLSKKEDIIVSGSKDNKIKFWIKQNQWVCQQTIIEHKKCVNALSLNNEQNRLISCGDDQQILIINFSQQDKKWIVQQKINVNNVGNRLCFINNKLFTFQEVENDQLHIYEFYNIKNGQQYIKTKDVQIKYTQNDGFCLFPQQYIQSKDLLVSKSGQYVNLIKIMKDGQFVTEKSIEFQSNGLFGCMSEDGEYLITWDEISKEIQIRKYQEI
ncbi:unnamed protein product [Paramecium pentaurelia]|uniref:WD40-repeat-containing domain n=1 Tax=Paramecium pentaurelia TaxID=43138 RepID=A0A8S1XWA7_9CILI|nr:unnamed protein product [Paramecium pentaurelia]